MKYVIVIITQEGDSFTKSFDKEHEAYNYRNTMEKMKYVKYGFFKNNS